MTGPGWAPDPRAIICKDELLACYGIVQDMVVNKACSNDGAVLFYTVPYGSY